MKQGEIWWADLEPPVGRRPVLILTRSFIIDRRSSVTVALISRTTRDIPSEVKLGIADGLKLDCAVSLDEIATVRKQKLDRIYTRLSPARMIEVFAALRYAFDMPT